MCIFFIFFSNTKNMTVSLIVVAVLIFVVSATLYFNISLEYDVLNNVGKLKIRLYKIIVLFSSGITISDSYLNFNKKRNKVIKIKIDFNDEGFQFVQDMQTYLIHKLCPTKINFAAVVASENPCLASMTSTILNVMVSSFFARIKNSVGDVTIKNNIQTGFRQTMFKLDVKLNVLVSLYDFVWAFLKAYKARVKRREKRRKQIAKY